MTTLTPQREKFAQGVASGLSQAEAYRQAYPKSQKWKDQSVWRKSSDLMLNVQVSARVKELSEEAAKKAGVTAERVMRELAMIAFSDPRRVMSWGAHGVVLRESSELKDEDAAIVAEVSQTESATGGSLKLKTYDKLKALELIGRRLGMWNDKQLIDMNLTTRRPKEETDMLVRELFGNGDI